MELIALLLLPFPTGFFVRQRIVAYLIFVGAFSYIFTFQTMTLTRAWAGGDFTAFDRDATTVPWSYGLVNLVFYAAGLGLVALGHRLGERRRNRNRDAVDITA